MGVKSKEYLAIKNFIHNEVGLSKQELRELIVQAVKDEAKSFVARVTNSNPSKYVDEVFKQQASKEIKNLMSGRNFNRNSDKIMTVIGKEIANQIVVTTKR